MPFVMVAIKARDCIVPSQFLPEISVSLQTVLVHLVQRLQLAFPPISQSLLVLLTSRKLLDLLTESRLIVLLGFGPSTNFIFLLILSSTVGELGFYGSEHEPEIVLNVFKFGQI